MAVEVVLFDVFGTLVDYEPVVSRLRYPATHALVESWGLRGDHDEFVAAWSTASAGLEATALVEHREYGMLEVAAAFGATASTPLTEQQERQLATSFLAEWKLGIRPISGVQELIGRLADSYDLGVVSNTHDPDMVPELLDRLGVLSAFDVVLLSIDHGHRKPHPSIYAAAIDAFGRPPDRIGFVGDTHDADFAGPRRAGMQAWLIDPLRQVEIDPALRLDHVGEIEAALLR